MKRIILIAIVVIEIISICVILLSFFILIKSQSYTYETTAKAKSAEVAIVPGAAILNNGGLSPVLRDRVDAAIALYKANKVAKILVSGDNSTVSHNEVNPARNYLLDKGIPDQDIFLDHAGFDTYSTMYRARVVFAVNDALIVTQSFHLPRAIYIARELGIDAYGVSADNGHYYLYNYIREIFANAKAALDLLTHRVPKYLGDQIPITGDGRNYP